MENILRDQVFLEILNDHSFSTGHDIGHMRRVVKWAKRIGEAEGADMHVVIPAAWLHDLIDVPKDSPDRSKASLFSAEAAIRELQKINYPEKYHEAIFHAIHAHSFSANVPCETLEAKVVQDADRLESLGTIGMMRTFATGARMKIDLFHDTDPFGRHRELDDGKYSVDHFFVKLFKLPDMLNTESAREEAGKRVAFMQDFVKELEREAV